MPRNSEGIATRCRRCGTRADAEGRDLTPDERDPHRRARRRARSRSTTIEKKMREIGGGGGEFRDPHRPERSDTGGGPGDVFVKSPGYQRIADSSGRGQTWTTGRSRSRPPTCWSRARCSKRASAARVAGRSRRSTSPGSCRSCSSRSACRDVFGQSHDDRQPGAVRQRGHRDSARCRRGRGRHQARVDDRHGRGGRADQEDRHRPADLGRVARGRPVDPDAT